MSTIIVVIFLLSSGGLSHILTSSSLLGPIRKLLLISNWLPQMIRENLTCNQCAGYWVGIFLWILISILYRSMELKFIILEAIFIYGPISSLMADLFYRLKQYLCGDCG